MAEPMKIRVTQQGDLATVKVLMNHVMESGLRKDPKTKEPIPAHFIQNLTVSLNDTPVMEAELNGSVSQNPYLSFKIKGAKPGDKVTMNWQDSKGESGSGEALVP
ncbi:MAG: thiosulfate oxidation carrier complex protein SoxZ [Gammaproteobacteria bacterium]|nr:thiosulfate oxidation carrier complex protein SoxZ [Gammaproteobacteria bacterium]MBU1655916.1 thiosulfate oxidation carrier complex protein SoxZ [Gammaproteobacteria bacterium]MBU1961788.1 thiosulfate oxidation carrier complex protein SoxZ [Gammaproteobacteria bacterium]